MRAFAAPPRTEAELAARAEALAGRTLAELAAEHGMAPPTDARRSKGWAGRLLEVALGATAASRAEPDFPHLGVELKTVPVDRRGRPSESTYVCTAPLDPGALGAWDTSWVRRKLLRVLWVPLAEVGRARLPPWDRVSPDRDSPDGDSPDGVATDPDSPDGVATDSDSPDGVATDRDSPDRDARDRVAREQVARDRVARDRVPPDRVIGAPVLWSPSAEEDAILRADFEELAALIAEGSLWQLDGRRGVALHLRPKAADGEPAAWALDEDGGWVKQTARGFYLRPSFTGAILARHLLLPR